MFIIKSRKIYDYEIYINLKQMMKKRNINRFKLAQLSGTKLETINRFYFNEIYRVDLDILLRFCIILQCDIDDIIKIRKK